MIKSLLNTLLFCLFAIAASAQFTLEDSLKLYYPFNGNANDASGNGFNGTVNNGAALTTDRFGNANSAYSFDGTNDWIDTDETFDYEYRTVSVWFYPEDSTSRSIINQDANNLSYGAFSSTITSSNHLNARAGGLGSKVIVPNIGTGNWYHLVLQRNADSVFYYINGVLVADSTANSGGSVANANVHTVIGVHRNESSQYFDGKIDDIRIYNRRLSQCEINQLYCAAAPCISPQDTIIPKGQTLTFNNVGGPNDSIAWSINGIYQSGDSAFTNTFGTAGTYIISVYSSDSSCAGFDTITVHVLPSPPCIGLSPSQKISEIEGSFSVDLGGNDQWGRSIESIGDADNDGVTDIVVGALHDDDGGSNKGAIYVLYLNPDGTVKNHHKISSDSGGFGTGLASNDKFGTSIANIGDLNSDGYDDLAVGASFTNESGSSLGAMWIVFLDSNEQVASKQKISQLLGNLSYNLTNNDRFGLSVASIGDLNQDGNNDIIVGIQLDDVSGTDDGSIAVLFLNANGTVHHEQIINDTTGNFPLSILSGNQFGSSISPLGDFDNDGNIEIVVGSQGYNSDEGAIYIVTLDTGGLVLDASLIAEGVGGFGGSLSSTGRFGTETETVDLNNDGFQEIIVGNWRDDDGGTDKGAFWILSIDDSGYVYNEIKVSNTQGGFDGNLDNGDQFGQGISAIGDLNNDGITDLAVGATLDDDGGGQQGAIYIIPLYDSCCTAVSEINLSDTVVQPGTSLSFSNVGSNGDSIAWLINDSLVSNDSAFSYSFDSLGYFEIVLVTSSSCISRDTVRLEVLPPPLCLVFNHVQNISDTEGDFSGVINSNSFSWSVEQIGDFFGDGANDVVVGALSDDDGGTNQGAIYLLNLNAQGKVNAHVKISADSGSFGSGLAPNDQFGNSVANIGDLNNDGITDLAVGAVRDDDLFDRSGSVWILFLDSSGQVGSKQKISALSGGFTGSLDSISEFGSSVCSIGDLNNDGNNDLLVGSHQLVVNSVDNVGAVWVLFLNSDGTVNHHQKISNDSGNLGYNLSGDNFGLSCSYLGDYNNDGYIEVAVGAAYPLGGAVYVLSLDSNGNVHSSFRITEGEGGFNGTLASGDGFGASISDATDINNDGVVDFFVGAERDDDGATNSGSIYRISLGFNNSIVGQQKISNLYGNLPFTLGGNDYFGWSIDIIGDINNDNVTDIIVGSNFGSTSSTAHILFGFDTCCTANSLISSGDTSIALGSSLSLSNLGMNGDSITWHFDGNLYSNDSSISLNFSSVGLHELVLTTYATCISRDTIEIEVDPPPPCIAVDSAVRISNGDGNFSGDLDGGDLFGFGLDAYIDLNGDGTKDLLIGAPYDDDGGSDRGAIYVTLMNMNGTVQSHHKISSDSGNFGTGLANGDRFGEEIATIGDLNDDGFIDIAVSAPGSDDGGSNKGAIWILFLDSAGEVDSKQKISDTQGSFTGTIGTSTQWGNSIAGIDDLNNDGVEDILVGHAKESDGGTNAGAAWVLFMNTDGTVDSHQKISNSQGSLGYTLSADDHFGGGASYLGDYNIDGYPDVIVAAHRDDVGSNTDVGSFYILSLDTNGTVHSSTKITENEGGFDGTIGAYGTFGQATTSAGDINQDGFLEILVSEWRDNDGANEAGACWILSIDSQGYVFSNIKISNFTTNFNYTLSASDRFGVGLCAVGDLNQDGIQEIAVGARGTDLNGTNVGATYIISLVDTCCIAESIISMNDTVVTIGALLTLNNLGTNGDSVFWKVNGSILSNTGSLTHLFSNPGLYEIELITKEVCIDRDIVFIRVVPEATCIELDSIQKVSKTQGNFNGNLGSNDRFGFGLCPVGDINQDGVVDIATNSIGDDDGGSDRGAVYILFMNQDGTVNYHSKISSDSGNFGTGLSNGDRFGYSISELGDLNGDGYFDIAVGAPYDDDGGSDRGAIWILFLDSIGEVLSKQKISDTQGNLSESLSNGDRFGQRVGKLGDLNGDGVEDLLVGMTVDDVEHTNDGSVMILFLNTDGTVNHEQKIGEGLANFPYILDDDDRFAACSRIGDINNNGNIEIAVGSAQYDGQNTNQGCVYILSLDTGGLVTSASRITTDSAGFFGDLNASDEFGIETEGPGDLNDDGYFELLVGAWMDDDGGTDRGSFWILSLDSSGYVFDYEKYSSSSSVFNGELGNGDLMGKALISLGDLNGDNVTDIAVGARQDDDGSSDAGAFYILFGKDTCCTVNASFTQTDSNICIGDTVSFVSTSTGLFSPLFSWYVNDSLMATGSSFQHEFLEPGNHFVELFVDDSCSRSFIRLITVNQNTASIAFGDTAICDGDTAQLLTSNAVEYLWSNGATLESDTVDSPMAFPTSNTIYYVTMTDSNTCEKVDSVLVDVNPIPSVQLTGDSTICLGDSTELTVSGANTYSWTPNTNISDTIGTSVFVFPIQTTTYHVSGTDTNGCSNIDSILIHLDTTLQSTVSSFIEPSCNGFSDGKVFGSGTGGTLPYSFEWSNGSTIDSILNIPSDTYNLTITDVNGCVDSTSIFLDQPDSLSINESVSDVSCFGGNNGSITATASGGTSGYSYSWSNSQTGATITSLTAGTYTVTANDANGCTIAESYNIDQPTILTASINLDSNASCAGGSDGAATASSTGGSPNYSYSWSNGATSATNSGLSAGSYSVTVTDANGCTDSTSIAITEPVQLTVSISNVTDASCFGGNDGTATASTTGGTGTISYAWSDGQPNTSATNLSAGSYTVTATDANGCTAIADTTISEPTAIAITLSGSNVICNGDSTGSATATASGGTGTITFNWSTGSTSNSITSIPAGTYIVTATDANSCETIDSITLTEPAQLVANISSSTSVLCNSGNDGTATVSATGGTTTYTYAWNTGASSVTATGLTAGQYTVTVTDAFGCTDTAIANVTEPNVLIATVILDSNVSCANGSDGSATASAAGGSPNYSYSWSNGATSATNSELSAGSYSVTITDANGCTDSTSIAITEPVQLTISISNVTDASCFGGNDGTATASTTGGTGTISYAWSNGQSNTSATNLSAGSYTVTATDANGCTAIADTTISEPTAIAITLSGSNVICNGDSTGSATATASGGTGTITFNWSTGSTSNSITSIPADTYIVTATDANSCEAIDSITLTEPAQLDASISSTTSVLCNSGNDGTATASATGGTTTYTYAWNTGASSVTATGLTAGQYTVTVTDALGCTDTAIANVTEPNVLIATVILDSNVSCASGSDGSATASATGGSPNYTYSWSNGTTSAINSGLSASSYSVTITDANGCADSASISIIQPNPISISFTVTSPIQCISDSNGSLHAQVSGGNGNFTYNWNNGSSDSIAIGLYSALYSVTVTDTNGCVGADSFILTQPTAVSAMLDSTVDVLCNGLYDGLAFTSAAGGTGAYSFLWNNGDTLDDIDSLTSGTYVLTVSDANGCEDTLSVSIIELDPIIPNLTKTDVSCYDGTDGLINSSVTGGGSTFNYSWSNGQIAASATALVSNTYTLTVTDENNCIGIDSAYIDQPDSLFISLTAIDALCNDSGNGSIQPIAAGGTLPYSYLWSTGSVDSILVNLDSGLYSLTITDSNGCVITDSSTIGHPEAITSTTVLLDSVSCFGDSNGMGVVIASGGVGALSYVWSTGANTDTLSNIWADQFLVTISDTNNCLKFDSIEIYEPDSIQTNTDSLINVSCHGGSNGYIEIAVSGGISPYQYSWSNSDSASFSDSLSAGLYYVTVIDANGCLGEHQDSILEPDSLIVQIVTAQQINCIYDSNGILSSVISGGTAAYQYSWSTGGITESLVNLDTGLYSISITDTLGCVAIDSFQFESVSSLNAIIDSTNNLSCFNDSSGFISVFATDGVFPIDYSWSNGGADSAINHLLGGSYYYTVTDSLGCIDSGFSQIIEPTQIIASIDSSTNIDCFGDDDGMAFGSAIGGTTPYTYNWSSGGINDSVGQLDSGWHYLEVTDTLGCQSIDSVFIQEPTDTIQFNFSTTDAYCFGGLVGSVLAAPSGATSPYNLNWNTGDTTNLIENLAADTYYLTITDGNGCVYTSSDTVFEPNDPDTAILDIEHISCNGLDDGSISVTFVGGVAPYSYQWSTGDTTQSLTNLVTDTFSVIVRDSVMCTQIAMGIVLEPDSLIAKIALSSGILCHGDSNGVLESETSGGTMPYSYLWSNTEIDSSISGLDTGIYTLTITDTNGCVDSTEFMLSQPDSLSIDSVYLNQPSCYGLIDGSILVFTSGGVQPYNYQWTNLAIDSLNEAIGAGAYGISISDLNGCSLDSLFVLEQPDQVVVSATELSPTQCSNSNTGEASVSGVGGIGDLSFLWSNGSNGDTIISLYHGKYYVTGSDENGCESHDSVIINYLHQAPYFDLGMDTSTCNIDSMPFGIDSSYATMLWSNQLEGRTITIAESGEYILSVTDLNGCSWTDSILVSLNFSSPVNLIDDTTLCADVGETSIILDSDTEFQHYLWSNGDSASTILVDSTGRYWLVATNSAGCVSTDTTNISITTCYPFPKGCDGKSLIAYPVPSMDQVILETCFWPIGETQFTIFDLQGRMVDMFKATDRYTTLDISYYPAGVYVVKAIGPGVYEKVRIVKI